ncbi:hypothetical protein [Streptomyces sp. NPDC058579]|uniref:hypothetical protein n=1 Tax=Streptomyces sp. NPDC058579 TaxID=3346548 RepID=UPI00366127D0
MYARAVVFAVWAFTLLLVDAYVIHALWGQFLFTGASVVAMTYVQGRLGAKKQS